MADIYPVGQCTYWCALQQPWVEKYGNLSNAKDWAANWRRHGGVISSRPAVGDIACFQPGADGAFADGHVAVVISVGSNNFTVTEMNATAGPGHVDTRLCLLVGGIEFLSNGGAPAPAPQPAPHPAPQPAPQPQPAPGDYIVQSGDNLSTIAQRHGISLAALETANPQIKDPSAIFPGEVVHIPHGGPTPPPAPQPRHYVVQRGDSMSRIASNFHVTLAALEAANRQIRNPNLIYPGQVLSIP